MRYAFGGALCLVAVINAAVGSAWYLAVAVAVVGMAIVLGRRRIFRAGIARTPDSIVCRYIPWQEGNAYVLNLGLPLLAVASIAASYTPGYPAWMRFVGIILLVLTPLFTYAAFRMWHRCVLRFTPAALTVRLAGRGDQLTAISRERLQSITPKMIPNTINGGPSQQVEITYRPMDSPDGAVKDILVGLQFTVQPANLLNALLAWKDAYDDHPEQLLDRIELLLRG